MLPLTAKKFVEKLECKLSLVVYGSEELLRFVEELSESGKVEYRFVDGNEPTLHMPAIEIEPGIFFHFLPKHSELEAFLAALKARCSVKRSDNVDCLVITFVSEFCPNCRAAVDAFCKACMRLGAEYHIVDVNSDLAARYSITSVPTTFVCDFKFVGAMSDVEAEKWILDASRGEYSDYLAEKLRNGELEIVKELVREKKLGGVLAELMAHREFVVRLGAMAALEALAEDEEIVCEARSVISSLLKHEDERIREDAAMMLGLLGSDEDIVALAEAAKSGGRVGDSAEEAIKKIRRREGG